MGGPLCIRDLLSESILKHTGHTSDLPLDSSDVYFCYR